MFQNCLILRVMAKKWRQTVFGDSGGTAAVSTFFRVATMPSLNIMYLLKSPKNGWAASRYFFIFLKKLFKIDIPKSFHTKIRILSAIRVREGCIDPPPPFFCSSNGDMAIRNLINPLIHRLESEHTISIVNFFSSSAFIRLSFTQGLFPPGFFRNLSSAHQIYMPFGEKIIVLK